MSPIHPPSPRIGISGGPEILGEEVDRDVEMPPLKSAHAVFGTFCREPEVGQTVILATAPAVPLLFTRASSRHHRVRPIAAIFIERYLCVILIFFFFLSPS